MKNLNLCVAVMSAALAPLGYLGCSGSTEVVRTTQIGTGGSSAPAGTGGSVGTVGTGGSATPPGTGGTTVLGTGGATADGAGGATSGGGTGGRMATGTGGAPTMGTPDAGAPDAALDPNRPIKVLIWNNALAYGHQSRITAVPLLVAAGAPLNIQFDLTYSIKAATPTIQPEGQNDGTSGFPMADGSVFSDAGLDQYDVVFFLNTTGNTLNVNGQEAAHKQALINFMEQKGRGFVGTHSATDTYQGAAWTWYVDFIGANFASHSAAGTPGTARYQPGVTHPILTLGTVPNPWNRSEEWYTFTRDVTSLPGLTVLLTCTDTGATALGQRPTAWVKTLSGGGRLFYSAFGHNVSAFREPEVIKMIMTGIRWAAHRIN